MSRTTARSYRRLRRWARVARYPATSSLVMCLCTKVADSGDEVTQKQRFAIVGTRAPACANRLSMPYPDRNRIFVGGRYRRACQLSPGLLYIAPVRSRCRLFCKKMHEHCPSSANPFPVPSCACFSADELSECPSIIIDDRGEPGDDGRATLECDGDT